MNCQTYVTLRQLCRVIYGCGIITLGCGLSGCSYDLPFGLTDTAATPTPFAPVTTSVEQGQPLDDFLPETQNATATKKKLGLTADEAQALGCSIKDRFDRTAALAYIYNEERSRLSLHLGLEGPSFSDPDRFEVDHVMVRFTHKFGKLSSKQKRKCLYPSHFQGIAGSVYNELVERENYTIWHELRERGMDFR